MAATAQEIERKYEAGPAVTLPGLSGVQGVAQETDLPSEDLSAEYYDTDDLRLIRAGVTLRRRRGGHDAGWHLKLPAGADTRQEIRLPLGRAGRRVPAELARLVRGWTRGAALGPVAQIGTIRQRRALLDGSGASLAEVAIDEVSAQSMGDSTTLSAWREIEVELTGGDPDLLEAIDKRLREAGLSPAGHSAKLARALAGRLPETPAPAPLAPGSAARQVVLAYAADQVAKVQATHPRVRRDEPESVHDMRVATRRLRSTLKTFAAVLAGPDAGPDPGPDPGALRAELKWLADVLGEARDTEVLEAALHGRLAELPAELLLGPVQARVTSHFASREASARGSVLEALDSARYLSLLDALTALVAGTPEGQHTAPDDPAASPRAPGGACGRPRRKRCRPPCGRPTAGCAAGPAGRRPRPPGRPGTPPCTRSGRQPRRSGTPPSARRRRSGRTRPSWPSGPRSSSPCSATSTTRSWPGPPPGTSPCMRTWPGRTRSASASCTRRATGTRGPWPPRGRLARTGCWPAASRPGCADLLILPPGGITGGS